MIRHRGAKLLIAALIALVAAAPVCGAARGAGQHPPTIVLIVIDGCPARSFDDLPKSSFLTTMREQAECGFSVIDTVFPSSTAAGHGAIFTGSYPQESGVTGKEYVRDDGELGRFDSPSLITGRTLFEVAHAVGLRTAMISAKGNVRLMLSQDVDASVGPDAVPEWVLDTVGPPPDKATQYQDFSGWHRGLDQWVLNAAEAYLRQDSVPAFVGINLGSLDKLGHRYGPTPAEETLQTLISIDEGISGLVRTLDETCPGDWSLIITADHGMTRVVNPILANDIVDAAVGGQALVTLDGGVLYVWAEEGIDGLAQTLSGAEGVAEVIGPKDKERRVALHIDNPRTPPLIAVAQRGYMFIESEAFMEYTLGSHGTTIDSDVRVPIMLCGPRAAGVSLEGVNSVTQIAEIVEGMLGIE